MARLLGILLAVGMIWTSVEIYANGTRGAFGGKLAVLMGEERTQSAESTLSTPRRAGAAVERAHQRQQERYDELLGD